MTAEYGGESVKRRPGERFTSFLIPWMMTPDKIKWWTEIRHAVRPPYAATTRYHKKSPSSLWRREHGTKIVHHTRWSAFRHKVRMTRKLHTPWSYFQTYECRWTNDYRDGETATRHWHLGSARHVRDQDLP